MRFATDQLTTGGILFAVSLLLVGLTTPADAFSSGPPDGYAGAPPGFRDCTQCHSDFGLNEGDGSLTVTGLPEAFFPGETYDLSVVLEDPEQMRWGFELTILDGSDQAAGTLVVTDPLRTQLSEGDLDYLKQTSEGTDNGTPNGPVSWNFQWIAPDASLIRVYLTGNGANGDFGTTGDYIYASTFEIFQDQGTPVVEATWAAIKGSYRR